MPATDLLVNIEHRRHWPCRALLRGAARFATRSASAGLQRHLHVRTHRPGLDRDGPVRSLGSCGRHDLRLESSA